MMKPTKEIVMEGLLATHLHNGEPINFPPGQKDIYRAILYREHKRIQITCCTQYGKTHTVGCACLPVTCIQHRKVIVIAPTTSKAKLIMRDYIDHIGDEPLYYEELEKNTKLDRLRMEENKERITLKGGGGIYVVSAQEGNSTKKIQAAMGEGAEIVILDEGALISDDTEATIFRMGAGQGDKFCYIKIGNPFTRGHFYKSAHDPRYYQINIDYKQALAEGRYTQAFIDEARAKPLFDVLFENKFPSEKVIDSKGFRKLMLDHQIEECREDFGLDEKALKEYVTAELEKYKENVKFDKLSDEEKEGKEKQDCIFQGKPHLGVDVAEGGNNNAFVLRFDNYGIIVERNTIEDLMQQVPIVSGLQTDYRIADQDIAIDDTGVGGGVTDRLEELDHQVNGVKTGGSPWDNDYLNIRAENMFLMRDWLVNQGGKLIDDPAWSPQLNLIRYKENSSSKLQIESKEDMKKRAKEEGVDVDSPDEVDALALTFSNAPVTTADDFAIV